MFGALKRQSVVPLAIALITASTACAAKPPRPTFNHIACAERLISASSDLPEGLAEQLRQMAQTYQGYADGANPAALWSEWNGDVPLPEASVRRYSQVFGEAIQKNAAALRDGVDYFAAVGAAHAHASAVLAGEDLRLWRKIRTGKIPEAQSEDPELVRQRGRFHAVSALSALDGLKRPSAIPDRLRQAYSQLFLDTAKAYFEFEDVQVRKIHSPALGKSGDAAGWEIVPTEGDGSFQSAARTLAKTPEKFKLVFFPRYLLTDSPPGYMHGEVNLVFVTTQHFRACGVPERDLAAFQRSEKDRAQIGNSDSGLDLVYHFPAIHNAEVSARNGLSGAKALAQTGAAMPDTFAEVESGLGGLGHSILDSHSGVAYAARCSLAAAPLFDTAMAEVDRVYTKTRGFTQVATPAGLVALRSNNSGGYTLVKRGSNRTIEWAFELTPQPQRGSFVLTLSSGSKRISAPVKTKRQRALVEKLFQLLPAGSTPRSFADITEKERQIVWELLATLKRFNELVWATNKYLEAQSQAVLEHLPKALQEKTDADIAVLKQLLSGLEVPNFSNATIRTLPTAVDLHRFSTGTDFVPETSAAQWIHAPRPFVGWVEELSAAEGDERKRVLEKIGMFSLIRFAVSRGWTWKDVSADNVGYDLLLEDPTKKRRLHVEVKARSGGATYVSLSANEIEFALQNPQQAVLAVVSVEPSGQAQILMVREAVGTGTVSPAEISRSYNLEKLLSAATGVGL